MPSGWRPPSNENIDGKLESPWGPPAGNLLTGSVSHEGDGGGGGGPAPSPEGVVFFLDGKLSCSTGAAVPVGARLIALRP